MSKPVLSLDVSKNSSYAATYFSLNEPFKKPFSVPHTPQGVSMLVELLEKMELLTGKKPEVILESTGNYSKSITYNLQLAGYPVIILNPIQTHLQKRQSIRKVKTDPVDAKRIAEVYYLQNFTPQKLAPPAITDLRNLCRHYDRANKLFTQTQQRFQNILELLFPYYPGVFSDICSESSLNVLAAFPSPNDVLAASKEDIFNLLFSKNQRKTWPEQIYQKLMAAAQASLPYKVAEQSNVRVLTEYIPILMTHKRLLTGLRAQIVAAAKEIPAFDLLKSIPGIGDITAAVIVSEIGDVFRFPTVEKLIAFAGLDVSVFESGRFRASNNKISKRGSSYLRKALFQAAHSAIIKNKQGHVNPILHEFYARKVEQGKPKMVALIATSSKLLRIIYGMWRKNEPFKVS